MGKVVIKILQGSAVTQTKWTGSWAIRTQLWSGMKFCHISWQIKFSVCEIIQMGALLARITLLVTYMEHILENVKKENNSVYTL